MKTNPFFEKLNSLEDKIVELKKIIMGKPEFFVNKKIITNKECMELLDVSAGTLNNWRKQGYLPFKKIDNKIYYLTDDLIKLLKS